MSWVVVDDDCEFHAEAKAYLGALRARDCSINTERVYAIRIALYLSSCDQQGIDWCSPTFYKHSRIKQYLKDALPPPSDGRALRIETVINSPDDLS